MGFRGKIFDVQILRAVNAKGCNWPELEERRSETLGGNRAYCDFGRIGWREVIDCLAAEREVIRMLETSLDWEDKFDEWSEMCDENGFLFGMDLGTNSITAALSASRCLTYYSCNGGAFGGGHNDSYPVIAFFSRQPIFSVVEAAAEAAGTGLESRRGRATKNGRRAIQTTRTVTRH